MTVITQQPTPESVWALLQEVTRRMDGCALRQEETDLHRDNIIHGAVAWLRANAGANQMAINRGLFSIRAVGDSARITNRPDFEPKAF